MRVLASSNHGHSRSGSVGAIQRTAASNAGQDVVAALRRTSARRSYFAGGCRSRTLGSRVAARTNHGAASDQNALRNDGDTRGHVHSARLQRQERVEQRTPPAPDVGQTLAKNRSWQIVRQSSPMRRDLRRLRLFKRGDAVASSRAAVPASCVRSNASPARIAASGGAPRPSPSARPRRSSLRGVQRHRSSG